MTAPDAQLAGLSRALVEAPTRRSAYVALARRQMVDGRFTEAVETASALVALDPDWRVARVLLAEASTVSGDLAGARRELAAGVALEPRSADAQLVAARAYAAAGDPRRACAHLRALGDIDPGAHRERADRCWGDARLSTANLPDPPRQAVAVEIDGEGSVAVVTPSGRVVSPGVFGPTLLEAGVYHTVRLGALREVTVSALGNRFTRKPGEETTLATTQVTIPPRRYAPRIRY